MQFLTISLSWQIKTSIWVIKRMKNFKQLQNLLIYWWNVELKTKKWKVQISRFARISFTDGSRCKKKRSSLLCMQKNHLVLILLCFNTMSVIYPTFCNVQFLPQLTILTGEKRRSSNWVIPKSTQYVSVTNHTLHIKNSGFPAHRAIISVLARNRGGWSALPSWGELLL